MKILLFIDSLGSGGAQRQIVELATGLKKSGLTVTILTYINRNFYCSILKMNSIEHVCIQESNILLRVMKIRKFIRKRQYGCIISFLDVPNIISILSSFPFRTWKLIVGERSANPLIINSFRSKCYKIFYVFSDFIVANSYANIALLRKIIKFPEKKLKVIYNIVDSDKWLNNNTHKFNNKRLKIIIPASHRYLKNLDNLIKGINLLSPDEKDKLSIEWYGDSIVAPFFDNSYPDALNLIKMMKLQQLFTFYPASNKIHSIIKNADAVGLFSFYEGLPNVVCEAMYSGKPVLASHISDIPLLINDKKLLFNPKSCESIKESLSYLLSLDSHNLTKIGDSNKLLALKLFDKKTIINQYIDLLK